MSKNVSIDRAVTEPSMKEPVQYVRTDPDGSMRVGNTRVLLDVVVEAFNDGRSAEGVRHGFSTLTLAQAYGAIAFYLDNKEFVDAYLVRRQAEAEVIRAEVEKISPPKFTREILMARLRERAGQVA